MPVSFDEESVAHFLLLFRLGVDSERGGAVGVAHLHSQMQDFNGEFLRILKILDIL